MKQLSYLFKRKTNLILAILLSSLFLSCSKSDNNSKPEIKPFVSNWITPSTFSQVTGRPVYFKSLGDDKITEDLVNYGKVLVYVEVYNVLSTNERGYYALPYTTSTGKEIKFSAQKGYINFASDFEVNYGNKIQYSFTYVLLPKGFNIPSNIDINNFENAASFFKINKR